MNIQPKHLCRDQELDLLIRWAEGDPRAGGLLLSYFEGRLRHFFVLRTGNSGSVDDLVQETLFRVASKAKEHPDTILKSCYQSSVGSYVFCVARFVLLEHQRRTHRAIECASPDAGESGEWAAPSRLEACFVQDSIMQLVPASEWKMLLEKYHYGLSHQEIAQKYSLSDGAVRSKIRRIRERITEVLETK